MKTLWVRGPRVVTDAKGKHKGPVVKQLVVKVLSPRKGV